MILTTSNTIKWINGQQFKCFFEIKGINNYQIWLKMPFIIKKFIKEII